MDKVIALLLMIIFVSGCSGKDFEQIDPQNSVSTQNDEPRAPLQIPQTDDKISTFQTEILDKQDNRINNVGLACAAISGKVLQSGEEFSFNAIVGERTADRGYKKAYIIVGNKKEKGIGGGICQVSSTIYQAALGAGLEITERHGHTKPVGYIEMGKDATISGDLDFKFKNSKSFPIKITVESDGNIVVADIWKV